MTETESLTTAIENPQNVAQRIELAFESLPKTPSTDLLGGWARGYLRGARSGNNAWEDSLYFAGVGLAHAQAHAGISQQATPIDGGWYFTNELGWNKQPFAEVAIPAYVKGYNEAKQIVPSGIQQAIRNIHPEWLKESFGLDYNAEAITTLLTPRPAVMPFDHFTPDRKFIGGVVQYPSNYNRRVFKYMKAWDYPPTMWYSDRPENDFEGYVTTKAANSGIAVSEAIHETGRHEATHILAIDPAVRLAMAGHEHSWITEGIAQYYGDQQTYRSRLKAITTIPDAETIADTAGKPVDYSASLLLTLGLASKMGGDITEGMEAIVRKIADKAKQVAKGQEPKIESPLALLHFIDPSLKDRGSQELRYEMERVLTAL